MTTHPRFVLPRRGVAAVLAGGAAATVAATPADASMIAPVFERVIGGPGHAGLYGWGVAALRDGTMLVGDYWNYRVLRFAADGSPLGVFTANHGHGSTQFYAPYGIGQDPNTGEVYIADCDKNQVDVYSEGGTYLRSWGGQGTGPGKYLYPSRVVVNSVGTVFVADTWEHQVVMTDTNGNEMKQFGGFGSKPGQMKSPHGMGLDADDNLYIADQGNKRVDVFDRDGNFVRMFGTQGKLPGQFGGDLRGVAVDKVNGWVYVVDGEGNRIHKFDLMGTFITRWGSNGHGPGQFADGGREAAVDQQGNLWVGDMPNFRVQRFSPTGEPLGQYPDPAQPPPNGGFNAPRGVAVNPAGGAVAVSDTYNWRVQTFTNDGVFVNTWGERGRGDYEFNYARLLAYSPLNGDLVIVDSDNGRVKAYTPDGVFKWSTGQSGKGTLGLFKNPQGVTIGPDGTIYVADSNNKRVQVLTKDGVMVRAFGDASRFNYPRGIAVDPVDGTLWVADSAGSKITHWAATGAYLGALAVPAGTTDRAVSKPFGIVADTDRIYVADPAVHKIKVFTRAGALVGTIGSRGTLPGRLIGPNGLALHEGRLYVAEEGNERVSVFNLNTR